MYWRWRTRVTGTVATLVLAVSVLSACTPAAPIGVRKDGDKLTILIGHQCGAPGGELSMLRVRNYDRRDNKLADAPLWEVQADRPRMTPSVVLGVVPEGFRETANTLGSQGVGATLALDVEAGRSYHPLFDVDKMRDGKVLDSDRDIVSERDFNRRYGCS